MTVQDRQAELDALYGRIGEARAIGPGGIPPLPDTSAVDPRAARAHAWNALRPGNRVTLSHLLDHPQACLGAYAHDDSSLDFAAVMLMVRAGLSDAEIVAVWRDSNLGAREKVQRRDDYVMRTIANARARASPVTGPPLLAAGTTERFRIHWDDEVENLPPPEYLVEGYLVRRSMASLYGPSGGGKTFCAIDFAMCVATGRDWHGHGVKQGIVVYIAAEGAEGLGQRVAAWKRHHGYLGRAGVAVIGEPANLLDPDDFAALVARLCELPEPPVLVVVDTLAWAMVGGDENSTRDMMQLMSASRRLKEEFDTTVLLVHHTNKSGEAERGNSALRAGCDTMLKLVGDGDALTLTVEKQKDGPTLGPRSLRLLTVDVGGEDEIRVSCVVEESLRAAGPVRGNARRALEALRDGFFEDGASATAWREAGGIPESSFYRTTTELVGGGLAERVRVGQRTRYVLTEAGRAALGGRTLTAGDGLADTSGPASSGGGPPPAAG